MNPLFTHFVGWCLFAKLENGKHRMQINNYPKYSTTIILWRWIRFPWWIKNYQFTLSMECFWRQFKKWKKCIRMTCFTATTKTKLKSKIKMDCLGTAGLAIDSKKSIFLEAGYWFGDFWFQRNVLYTLTFGPENMKCLSTF